MTRTLDDRRDKWTVFRTAHPNALLIGPEGTVQAAMVELHPYLRAPVRWWQPRAVLDLPSNIMGTLIIQNVNALDATQQRLLLEWMDAHAAGVQLISLTSYPLFPLVERGEFLDALYYRLNIVCLDLASTVKSEPR